MRGLVTGVVLGTLLLPAFGLGAPVVLPSSRDGFVAEQQKNSNEGANPRIRFQSAQTHRGLVAFDLAGVDPSRVASATLILTLDPALPPGAWGEGRYLDVQRLLEDWTEGNGKKLGVPPGEGTPGSGSGATWNCAADENIANGSANCATTWTGGINSVAPPSAPGVLVTNGLTGELRWDVTQDLILGAGYGWLVRKRDESAHGNVHFFSKEGDTPPRLEIEMAGLGIEIISPEDGLATNQLSISSVVDLRGPIGGFDLSTFRASLDSFDVTSLYTLANGQGTATLDVTEGEHRLRISVTATDGTVFEDLSTFDVDITEPVIVIQSPNDGATVATTPVLVLGMVQDQVEGTVNNDDIVVTVNGWPAVVANRGFSLGALDLVPGDNAIEAEAVDRAGNRGRSTIHVTYAASPEGVRLMSGAQQTGPILAMLPEPVVVAVRDAMDQPVVGAQAVFRVIRGSGTLDGGVRGLVVVTDAQGRASTSWTLGNRAGAGVDRMRVTAVGYPGELVVTATTVNLGPDAIHVASGNNQEAGVGRRVPELLKAFVTDVGDNPVEGVPVTFTVDQGGGSVDGHATTTSYTDGDGIATAELTVGPGEGYDNNVVSASFAGLARSKAFFRASGRILGDPAETSLVGIVLDNQDDAVPNATVRVKGTSLSTLTDDEGQFVMGGVPVGQIHVEVDLSTTTRPGTWANLEYETVTLPGVRNLLDRPIFVLPLDVASAAVVGGPYDVTLTMPELPGFSMTVKANSTTFPGGARTGIMHVTQVHADKIPMTPGSGMQPRLIVTIQPPGVQLDPPAQITYPNVDNLPPGTITEFFSFDHDLGMFASIGTGTVSEDGLAVSSDAGFGIVEGGWHCDAPSGDSGACQGGGDPEENCSEPCPWWCPTWGPCPTHCLDRCPQNPPDCSDCFPLCENEQCAETMTCPSSCVPMCPTWCPSTGCPFVCVRALCEPDCALDDTCDQCTTICPTGCEGSSCPPGCIKTCGSECLQPPCRQCEGEDCDVPPPCPCCPEGQTPGEGDECMPCGECPAGCPGRVDCPQACACPPEGCPLECHEGPDAPLLTLQTPEVEILLFEDSYDDVVCDAGDSINYVLCFDAEVTITIGDEVVLNSRPQTAGGNQWLVDVTKLTGYVTPFTVSAFGPQGNGSAEGIITLKGAASSALPIGATFVKGVNLHNGSAVISETDARLPGRGLSLELTRTYSSNNDDATGMFGVGWSSNWEARLVSMVCNGGLKYIVQGGEGSGFTFFDPEEGIWDEYEEDHGFRAQKGFHGTLTYTDPADTTLGFDFLTKGQVRYHFKDAIPLLNFVGIKDPTLLMRMPNNLEFIEDPNLNRIELTRKTPPEEGARGEITRIEEKGPCEAESDCRAFEVTKAIVKGGIPRARTVEVKAGNTTEYTLMFAYDQLGHLTKASRLNAGGPSRESIYIYEDDDDKDRNNLVSWTDRNGRVRKLVYYDDLTFPEPPPGAFIINVDDLVKDVVDAPESAVEQVTHFAYQGMVDQWGVTVVTDPEGVETSYRLDANGAPLEIIENVGGGDLERTTTIAWTPDDIVKEKETDDLGRVTEFDDDGRGNITEERIDSSALDSDHIAVQDVHRDGSVHPHAPVKTNFTYDDKFNKLQYKKDAEGVETTWEIDATNGNVKSMKVGTLPATVFAHGAFGVLTSVTDPRAKRTEYKDYDSYGNARRIEEPGERRVTVNEYDARSLLRKSSIYLDGDLALETIHDYDDLDRKTGETRIDKGPDPSPTRETRWSYVLGTDLVETETVDENVGVYQKTNSYDDLSRLASVTHAPRPTNTFTDRFCYDGNDNKTGEFVGGIVSRHWEYDALNHPVAVTVAKGDENICSALDRKLGETSFDTLGNKLWEKDLHGHRTDFVYDALYREVKRTLSTTADAEGNGSSRLDVKTGYDLVGNKTKEVDANGGVSWRVYDRVHRLEVTEDADGDSVTYGYDDAGNVTSEVVKGDGATEPLRTKTFDPYDGLNRVTGWSLSVRGAGTYPFHVDHFGLTEKTTDVTRNVETERRRDGFGLVRSEITKARDESEVSVETKTEYDPCGFKTRVTDGELHTTVYDHNALGWLLRRSVDGTSFYEGFDRDGLGNVGVRRDHRGVTWAYEYDAFNRVTSENRLVCEPQDGIVCSQDWSRTTDFQDLDAKIVVTEPSGLVVTSLLDGLEREYRRTDNVHAQPVLTAYDGINKRKVTDRKGHVTRFTYDAVNRLEDTKHYESVNDPPGDFKEIVSVRYDDGGMSRTETNANEDVTTYGLDGLGRVVSRSVTGSWAGLGANGETTETTLLETVAYDADSGNKATVTTYISPGDERYTAYAYDHRQRLVRMVQGSSDPEAAASTVNVVTEYVYDKDDLKREVRVGDDLKERSTYDALHRVGSREVGFTEVLGQQTSELTAYEYLNAAQEPTKKTDPEGTVTEWDYEEFGKVVAIRQYAPGGPTEETIHRYDQARNRVATWDGEDHLTSFVYDNANRLREVRRHAAADPQHELEPWEGTAETTYVPDENDNVAKITDARLMVTDITYDHRDREMLRTFTGEPQSTPWRRIHEVETGRDGNGNVTSVVQRFHPYQTQEEVETERFAYDHLDRLREKDLDRGGFGQVKVSYVYTDSGLRKSVTEDATTDTTSYTYDPASRLATVVAPGGGTIYAYTKDNLQDEVRHGNDTVCTYAYDEADRVERIETRTPGGGLISGFVYDYDDNGNRVREVQTRVGDAETTTYGNGAAPGSTGSGYDGTNRLRTVTYGSGGPEARTVEYTYDLAGNRVREVESGLNPKDWTFSYNSYNWLEDIRVTGSPTALIDYSYDPAGNQVGKLDNRESPAETTLFAYDARNHLRTVTKGGTVVEKAEYLASDRRSQKIGEDGIRLFTWDDNALLLERGYRSGQGPTIRNLRRAHFGSELLEVQEEPDTPAEPQYYHLDALGSVADVTALDRSVVTRHRYDVWGLLRDDTAHNYPGPGPVVSGLITRTGFTGHYLDSETGLYSTASRYLDPDTGRFITQDGLGFGDPANPPSLHLYYYAQANPLRYVDPDGHFAKPSPEAAARLAALAAEAAAAAGGTAAGAGVATAAAGVGAGVGMVAPFATAYDYTHGGENRGIYNWARGLGDFLADFRPSDQPGPKPGQRTKEHLREALVVEEATGPSPALDPKRGMVLTPNPVPNADSMALPLLPEGHPVLGPEPGTANAGSSGSGGSNIITLTPAAEDPKPDRPDLSTLTPDFVVTADGEALTADFLRALAAAREAHLPGSGATPNSKGDLGQDLLDVTVDGRGTPAPHTARPTSLGPRIADEEVSSAGYEVKNTARPQSNTSFFRRQMAKEKELLQTKQRTRSEVISVNGFTRAAEATAKSSGVTPTDLRGYPDIRDFPFP